MRTFLDRLRDNLAIAEREGDHWSAGRIKQTIAVLEAQQAMSPYIQRAQKLFVPQKDEKGMDDIMDRLRFEAEKARNNYPESFCVREDTAEEAADEIEKLRAAIQDLAAHVWRGDWNKLRPETRAALGEK